MPEAKPSPASEGIDILPVYDLSPLLSGKQDTDPEVVALCQGIASCLRDTGALVIRDPRCGVRDSDVFLNMMEAYFSQPHDVKMLDTRPETSYQVGATPEMTEVPRCQTDPLFMEMISKQPADHKAATPSGPDPKWRFFWRVGPRPAPGTTAFPELNAAPVVPSAFPRWGEVMDGWGTKLLSAVEVVSVAAALGLGLPRESFSSGLANGPHLVAPTGSDLARFGARGTVFAGFHYDLNFLTIHGKSRFPGLFVWLRDGRKVPVVVPEGCLLLQAGKQLEWLTGGYIQAGMHEVVFTDATERALEAAREAGRCTWRVSSTLFAHMASDTELRPLGRFALGPSCAPSTSDAAADAAAPAGWTPAEYPPTLAGDYVRKELEVIKLGAAKVQNGAANATSEG